MVRSETRAGRAFLWIAEADLRRWARAQNLTLWRAYRRALAAGVFPESLERNFPSLNTTDQLRLWDSRVLVAGLGGLGGMLTVLLARLGVGSLHLADGDVFTPANLNRQCLASWPDMGKSKAQVAARQVRRINPALRVKIIAEYLTPENLPRYLKGTQVVLDGLDSVPVRLELWRAAATAKVAMVHGAVLGAFGQVTTLLPGDPPDSLRHFYGPAATTTTAPQYVLAPTVSLVASLQVQEAVRLLLQRPPAYHRRLAYFDGDTGQLALIPLDLSADEGIIG